MTLDRIPSPYNFVPLSSQVFEHPWAESVSHDLPFDDGIDGTLELEITAETPLFIRGRSEGNASKFFTTPDGQLAIPGSSLRGMLRNVVEIATFSRMSRVNDHRYGVRDLQNRELYGDHMAAIMMNEYKQRNEPMPLVTAGWLTRAQANADGEPDEVAAWIQPCHFAKVEYTMLERWAYDHKIRDFDPRRKQSAPNKYRTFGPNLTARASIQPARSRKKGEPWLCDFGVVTVLNDDAPTPVTLVFTGQPQEDRPDRVRRAGGGRPKHHDFAFHGEVGVPIRVTRQQFRDFEFVHSDTGQQHRASSSPNEEWAFWKRRFDEGERVPVFFLMQERAPTVLRAFGLAMMFRLAYKHSIREALTAQQPHALDADVLDWASAIFGHVADMPDAELPARERAMAGRVSVGLARVVGAPRLLPAVTAVLGAPKASYYPCYLEQPKGRAYRTLMDPEPPHLAGWKRYRPQSAQAHPRIPPKASERVITRFAPVDAGSRFVSKLRVHNLRPAELGCLLWALDFGGEQGVFHQLGMARPLGYGRATLRVVEARCTLEAASGEPVSLDACRQAFVAEMEKAASALRLAGWQTSEQIFQLLACARPVIQDSSARYMLLDHPDHGNEFVAAKKERLRLLPAGSEQELASYRRAHGEDPTARAQREAQAAAERPKPARPAAPVPTADELDAKDRDALQRAIRSGNPLPILTLWHSEKGARLARRRELAIELGVTISAKWRKQEKALVRWLEGEGG